MQKPNVDPVSTGIVLLYNCAEYQRWFDHAYTPVAESELLQASLICIAVR